MNIDESRCEHAVWIRCFVQESTTWAPWLVVDGILVMFRNISELYLHFWLFMIVYSLYIFFIFGLPGNWGSSIGDPHKNSVSSCCMLEDTTNWRITVAGLTCFCLRCRVKSGMFGPSNIYKSWMDDVSGLSARWFHAMTWSHWIIIFMFSCKSQQLHNTMTKAFPSALQGLMQVCMEDSVGCCCLASFDVLSVKKHKSENWSNSCRSL